MKRVTGIGGVFFKAANPDQLREWYRAHLGIPVTEWGGASFRMAIGRQPGRDRHHRVEHLQARHRLLRAGAVAFHDQFPRPRP